MNAPEPEMSDEVAVPAFPDEVIDLPHPQGVGKLYARDGFRSVVDMERGELVALCAEMDLEVDEEWGSDRLRLIVGQAMTE